jgi:hypothetical protein
MLKPKPSPATYAWDDHPEAVLGTIYLYFASNCDPRDIGEERLAAFVERHQDDKGTLTASLVVTAVEAVRGRDGRSGPRPSKTLVALWDALAPVRERLPGHVVSEETLVHGPAEVGDQRRE